MYAPKCRCVCRVFIFKEGHGHPTGTREEGQLLDRLPPGEQEIHLNHQRRNGDPPAPSAQPTDEAKQMLDPTLNLG